MLGSFAGHRERRRAHGRPGAVADAAGVESANLIGLSEGGPLAVLFAIDVPGAGPFVGAVGHVRPHALGAGLRATGSIPRCPTPSSRTSEHKWGTGDALRGLPRRHRRRAGCGGGELRAPDRFTRRGRDDLASQRGHGRAPRARRPPGADAGRSTAPATPSCRSGPVEYLAERHPRRESSNSPARFHVGGNPGDDDDALDVDRGVRHRCTGAAGRRRRPGAQDGLVHRHRRLHRPGLQPRGPRLARTAGAARHYAANAVEAQRGVVVKRTGDGLLATFDGPGRGVRAALRGPATQCVRWASTSAPACTPGRSNGAATTSPASACTSGPGWARSPGPGEVLVTNTVKDLVIGSDLGFDDRGTQVLKGVPGEWHLWASV